MYLVMMETVMMCLETLTLRRYYCSEVWVVIIMVVMMGADTAVEQVVMVTVKCVLMISAWMLFLRGNAAMLSVTMRIALPLLRGNAAMLSVTMRIALPLLPGNVAMLNVTMRIALPRLPGNVAMLMSVTPKLMGIAKCARMK